MKFEGVNPDAFPIQIVNGVISLDFGRGCLGCKWCITKRQEGRDVLQEISYKNLLTGETLFKLLSKCLAFSEAKLPLRIGNNTDGTLIPIQELSCFLNEVKDHPTMLLTRGMHSRSLNVLLSQQGKNFMLAHTLTFPHESLQYYFKPEKLLRCFLDAQCKKVLNIGPICVQNMRQVESFLDSRVLEYGTKVIFAPLNLRKLPSSVIFDLTAEPISFLQRTYLESKARSLGLDVLRSNNCALALVTGRKSLEFGDINNGVVLDDSKTTGTSNYIPDAILCDGCLNRNKCVSSPEYSNKLLNELLDRLLLPRSRIITSGNMLLQIGVEGITKAETSYLSGMLGLRVTSPNSENIPSPTSLERWSRSGFYPVEEIVELSNEFDPMQVIFRN